MTATRRDNQVGTATGGRDMDGIYRDARHVTGRDVGNRVTSRPVTGKCHGTTRALAVICAVGEWRTDKHALGFFSPRVSAQSVECLADNPGNPLPARDDIALLCLREACDFGRRRHRDLAALDSGDEFRSTVVENFAGAADGTLADA